MLLHGFVDVPYFKNDLALEFWLILWLSSQKAGNREVKNIKAVSKRAIKNTNTEARNTKQIRNTNAQMF
jgi:hypothetical protein